MDRTGSDCYAPSRDHYSTPRSTTSLGSLVTSFTIPSPRGQRPARQDKTLSRTIGSSRGNVCRPNCPTWGFATSLDRLIAAARRRSRKSLPHLRRWQRSMVMPGFDAQEPQLSPELRSWEDRTSWTSAIARVIGGSRCPKLPVRRRSTSSPTPCSREEESSPRLERLGIFGTLAHALNPESVEERPPGRRQEMRRGGERSPTTLTATALYYPLGVNRGNLASTIF